MQISDFGMSHDVCDNYYHVSGGRLPLCWTAPELFCTGSTPQRVMCGAMDGDVRDMSLGHKPFEYVFCGRVCVCVVTRWSKIMLQCYEYLNVC